MAEEFTEMYLFYFLIDYILTLFILLYLSFWDVIHII